MAEVKLKEETELWDPAEHNNSPERPHIKDEPEEEQLQEFPFFNPVCVKTDEDDEDKSSVLHQRATEENREETNGEDCGAEAGCSSDPLTQLHSDSEEHTDSSSDTDHSEDYSQEQAPSKRSYAMISPDSSVTDVGGTDKPHRCSECGKRFQISSDLHRHELVHTGEKPFKCPFCVKGFTQQGNLKTHIRIHTGERPYSCSLCQKCFTNQGALSNHMLVHTGERPFSCAVCGKGFKLKGNLKGHMRTHTGDKLYKCEVCAKHYAAKQCLKIHMRIHTGEKPFSCSVCQRQFSDSSGLSQHKKKAHSETLERDPAQCSAPTAIFPE